MSLIRCDVTDVMCCLVSLSQETIEDIDKNGDGLIDLQEYIGEIHFYYQFIFHPFRRVETKLCYDF